MSDERNLPLSSILDALLDTVFVVDRAGHIVHVSLACEALLGYRQDELIGRQLKDFQHPEDRSRTHEESGRVLAGEARIGFENRYVHKQGHTVHVMWSARWSPDLSMRVGVARDVTACRHADRLQAAAYAVSEAAHDARDMAELCGIVRSTLEGLVSIADFTVLAQGGADGAVQVLYQAGAAAPGLHQGRGPEARELAGGLAGQGEADASSGGWLVLALNGQHGPLGTMLLRRPDGGSYTGADQDLLKFVAAQVAIALERKQLYDSLLQAATHDVLTGLPNRRLFEERLCGAMRRARRVQGRFGLLYVDVASRKSMTGSAMRPGTSCCARSARGWRSAHATATQWRASAATNSCCWWKG